MDYCQVLLVVYNVATHRNQTLTYNFSIISFPFDFKTMSFYFILQSSRSCVPTWCQPVLSLVLVIERWQRNWDKWDEKEGGNLNTQGGPQNGLRGLRGRIGHSPTFLGTQVTAHDPMICDCCKPQFLHLYNGLGMLTSQGFVFFPPNLLLLGLSSDQRAARGDAKSGPIWLMSMTLIKLKTLQ